MAAIDWSITETDSYKRRCAREHAAYLAQASAADRRYVTRYAEALAAARAAGFCQHEQRDFLIFYTRSKLAPAAALAAWLVDEGHALWGSEPSALVCDRCLAFNALKAQQVAARRKRHPEQFVEQDAERAR